MKIIHLQFCSWFPMLILYTFTNLSELHTSLNTWWRLVAVGAAEAEANCPHWETTATVAPQIGPSEKWPGVSEDLLVLQKYNWNASIILNLYKMNCTKIFSSSTFNQHIEIIFYLNLKYSYWHFVLSLLAIYNWGIKALWWLYECGGWLLRAAVSLCWLAVI